LLVPLPRGDDQFLHLSLGLGAHGLTSGQADQEGEGAGAHAQCKLPVIHDDVLPQLQLVSLPVCGAGVVKKTS
jgi:hypothetical protein